MKTKMLVLVLICVLLIASLFACGTTENFTKISEIEEGSRIFEVNYDRVDYDRGDKFWAPDKQKVFYSGITDTLKEYIGDRYGFDAPEMTTAELFDALKGDKSITQELFGEMKDLFETADFVKFAKHIVSNEDNARALPTAVRFVTSTYQAEIEEEAGGEEAAGE